LNKARGEGAALASAETYAIICTSLKTDNHASSPSSSSPIFYMMDTLPNAKTKCFKALQAKTRYTLSELFKLPT